MTLLLQLELPYTEHWTAPYSPCIFSAVVLPNYLSLRLTFALGIALYYRNYFVSVFIEPHLADCEQSLQVSKMILKFYLISKHYSFLPKMIQSLQVSSRTMTINKYHVF